MQGKSMGPKCVFFNLTGMSLQGSRDSPARSVVQKGWKTSTLLSGKACCKEKQSIHRADFFRFTLSFLCIKFFTRMKCCSKSSASSARASPCQKKNRVTTPLSVGWFLAHEFVVPR